MRIPPFLAFAAVASATPIPPAPRAIPERIDVSARPAVELVTKSAGSVLVETGGTAQSVEMRSPDGVAKTSVTLNWKSTREVQTTIEKDSRVAIFYDSDGDGLPDVRRVYERRDGNLYLITSGRLNWTITPDEYDPRGKQGKKG